MKCSVAIPQEKIKQFKELVKLLNENKKENKKKKKIKKEITKSYFTLDSVKHSLHIFYFGTRFTLSMQLLQEF